MEGSKAQEQLMCFMCPTSGNCIKWRPNARSSSWSSTIFPFCHKVIEHEI